MRQSVILHLYSITNTVVLFLFIAIIEKMKICLSNIDEDWDMSEARDFVRGTLSNFVFKLNTRNLEAKGYFNKNRVILAQLFCHNALATFR